MPTISTFSTPIETRNELRFGQLFTWVFFFLFWPITNGKHPEWSELGYYSLEIHRYPNWSHMWFVDIRSVLIQVNAQIVNPVARSDLRRIECCMYSMLIFNCSTSRSQGIVNSASIWSGGTSLLWSTFWSAKASYLHISTDRIEKAVCT